MATEHWQQHPTPDYGIDPVEWAKLFLKAKYPTGELEFHESLTDLDKACKAAHVLTEVEILRADRDAWSARCAALMTEKDGLATELAEEVVAYEEMLAMKNAWADRALTAERRLAERDRPLLLATRNPPT